MKKSLFYLTIFGSLGCLLAGTFFLLAPDVSGEEGSINLKCWRCKKSFEVPAGQREGKCPYCGAKYVLPPPTPVPSPSPIPGSEPTSISWKDGARYVGKRQAVKGTIVGTHLSARSGNLYLNFHSDYKNNLSILVEKGDVGRLAPNPDQYYLNKTVVATGQIKREKGYLRLIVTSGDDLVIVE